MEIKLLSSNDLVNDCLSIFREEVKQRLFSTNIRNEYEQNLITTRFKNAVGIIEDGISKILDETESFNYPKTGYQYVKDCLKIMNKEFQQVRVDILSLPSEDQSIIGNFLTSTEIELEKKIKLKLDEAFIPAEYQMDKKTIDKLMSLQFKLDSTGEDTSVNKYLSNLVYVADKSNQPLEQKFYRGINGFDLGFVACLIHHGYIKGELQDNGLIKDVNEEEARNFILTNMIKSIFK